MIPRHNGIRTTRYKLMNFYRFGDEWELYDLEKDPEELTNLYGKPGYEAVTADLKKQLQGLVDKYEDDSIQDEKPEEWKREMRSPGASARNNLNS